MKQKNEELLIYGIRPVLEGLAAEPCVVKKLFIRKGKKNPSLLQVLEESKKKKIEVLEMNARNLEKKFGILYHQGVVGTTSGFSFTPIESLVKKAFKETSTPVIVLLDQITDPGNLGGLIRSAESLGMQGAVIPKARASSISPVVIKRSAGSVSHFPISRIANLSQTINYLKKEKFWVVGTDAAAKVPIWDFKFDGPMAVVLGSESKGMRRLVSESCDFKVSVPLPGKTKSLNVVSAASVIFYEIHRQRNLNQQATE